MRPKHWFSLAAMAALLAAQTPDDARPPRPGSEDTDVKLPNGKSQREAIIKADYEKSLEDAKQLVKLSQELQSQLEKSDAHVISVSEIRNTEEIEKLAKKIRGRLKRL